MYDHEQKLAREVEERISKALEVCKRLKTFLKKTRCRFAWKLQVNNAVIVSKLKYGHETMSLNESLIKRLDAFQMKGIRHILGIEHAYWSRTSNEETLKRASLITAGVADITSNWSQLVTPNNEDNKKIIF